ncbi:MAG TPA: energy transducer TonB [Vicinamibacterales bacterium]|jgi:hypothetical protein|nr:energy transducer TonB [Vicinamibacterales bacterium]
MAQQQLRLRPEIVPLQWHEAVAVVQVVARQLMASDAEGPIPAVAGLAVDHNGSVHVLDGPHMPSTNRDGSKGLAALLRELLRGSPSTPASLASLADGTEGASERFTSIVDFSQALVFFERPLSQPDLAAHAARLATAQEQRRLNEELDQLTQKAREVEPAAQQKERGSTARRRSAGRKAAIAVLVVTFLLAIFVAALTGWNRIGSESVREVGSRLVERVRAEAKTVLTSEAPSESRREPHAPPDRPLPRRRAPASQQSPPPIPELPTVDPPAAAGVETGSRVQVTIRDVTPEARAERGSDAPATESVYSRANDEVEPPVIMRPQIRSEPPVGIQGRPRLATLILDIDEQGSVSQVRLASVSAEERYYAAMMVAAAKAWRFRPAHKDGRPVRYRLRLRVAQ